RGRQTPHAWGRGCRVPAEPLYSDTVPSDATGVMTRFATVLPASKLTLDVCGRAPPPHTATQPKLAGWVTATFNTTDDTALGSTQPRPPTFSTTVAPAATVPATDTPVPSRVSSTRWGGTGPRPPSSNGPPAR